MKGLLLINTGSPASSHRKDVRAFVEAMLSDPMVMTVPDWVRPILVKGIIGPTRQFKSAAHYAKIWDNEHHASPLMYQMEQLAIKVESRCSMPVEIGMRYLEPSIENALQRLKNNNPHLHEVVALPLFPQYAESSYQTVINALGDIFYKRPYPFRLKIIEPYFNHPAYIKALVESIRPYAATNFDYLLFNFHSLPLSHVDKGWRKGKEFDYVYQAKETVRLVTKGLMIDPQKVRLVYSSAIGKKWLKPDLDQTVIDLANEGCKSLLVVSPGFAVDNLETLYDITVSAKENFLQSGGIHFSYIPCLNSNDIWVDGIMNLIT